MVLLALYEKYTCLRFTERIAQMDKGQIRHLKALKKLMLQFQAFGTVTPANLSRWHNVKQIYAYLLEVNDIPAAIQDISSKLNLSLIHIYTFWLRKVSFCPNGQAVRKYSDEEWHDKWSRGVLLDQTKSTVSQYTFKICII